MLHKQPVATRAALTAGGADLFLSAARGLSRTRARRPEDGQRKIGDRTRERGVKQEFEAGQSYRGAPGGAGTIWMMDANRAGFPSFFGLR